MNEKTFQKAKDLRNTIIDLKSHIRSLKTSDSLKNIKSSVAAWYVGGGSGIYDMPEKILVYIDYIHRDMLIILEAKLAQVTKELEEL